MKTLTSPPFAPVRIAMLSAVLLGTLSVGVSARADEFSDVSQLLRAGKPGEALAKADQFLATKPRDPQMRFLRGVILTESGRASDAIAVFLKLTEDFPELPEPYNNLAVLYAGQSQFDKARAALEMAIRTNPSYATAHENLGDVYAKLASQAYSKALQLDGSNAAVAPKLALIRDLFAPGSKAQRPAASAPATAPRPATSVAAAPAVTPPVRPASQPVAVPAPGPVAAPPAAPAPAPAAGGADKEIEAAVRAWAAAWSAKDMSAYLAAYGKDFEPANKQARKAWEEDRRSRIVGKSRISVTVSDLAVSVNGDKATARFRQAYSADNLNVTSRKTLELAKQANRWVIVRESTGS